MNFTFLVVVLLTALAFVGVVIALSRAISPRSYNEQSSRHTNVVYRHVVNHGCSSVWATTCLLFCS